MNETLLLTVEIVGQAGDDLLVSPWVSANMDYLDEIDKIKVINQILEEEAAFSIPLGTPSRAYILLIPNTQKDDVRTGSQIWVYQTLEEITRKPDTQVE